MLAITVAPENSSRLLSTKMLKPEARFDDVACIALAIAQLMDPEWREFVEQEQHRIASSSLSEAQPLP
jgi:hypothetical protein